MAARWKPLAQREPTTPFERRFLFRDSLRPAAELDGTNTLRKRFVYASGRNVPDFFLQDGTLFLLVSDPRGSVRLVVNAATGGIEQELGYNEWGVVMKDTAPGRQPFGFGGGVYEAGTGLVHFGAREYDAATRRWMQKDPIGFGGGDSNLYAYVGNDPVNRNDPNGKDICHMESPEGFHHEWLEINGDSSRSYGFWPNGSAKKLTMLFPKDGTLASPDWKLSDLNESGIDARVVSCVSSTAEEDAYIEQWIIDNFGSPNQKSRLNYWFGINDCRSLPRGAIDELHSIQGDKNRSTSDIVAGVLWGLW